MPQEIPGREFSEAMLRRRRRSRWRPGRLHVPSVVFLTLWLMSPVQAQQTIRPEVDPGQVQKRIPLPSERREPPEPLRLPTPPEASPPAGKLHFVLAGVVLDGNTVFDAAALASTY